MEEKKKAEEVTAPKTGPSTGPQGVDKAPGEETSDGIVEFAEDTQKGKKVNIDASEFIFEFNEVIPVYQAEQGVATRGSGSEGGCGCEFWYL